MTASAASTHTFLGLDVGTSAVKAGLFSADGECLRRHRVGLRVQSPAPLHLELDPAAVWQAVVEALRTVLASTDRGAVRAIGVAAAAPTPLLVDSFGDRVSSICTFADARAASDVDAFAAGPEATLHEEATGNPIAVPTCSLLTGRRLASTSDLGSPVRFGHLASLVVLRLTGRWVMDPTNAAYTGGLCLSDPTQWSEAALERLDVASLQLPELLPSAEPAGRLSRDAADTLGLSPTVVVTVGCADTAAAALAVGCLEDGDAFESVGTSGVLTVCHDERPTSRHSMNRPHVIPGRWLSHSAMSSSGAAVAWLRERVLLADRQTLDELSRVAASAMPGSGGVVFLPYLTGERSPVWDPAARGAWVGMTLDTGVAELTRSVFEGAAYGLRQLLTLENQRTGNRIAALLSVGGGTNSSFWCSLKADVTGCFIDRADEGDVAARGAALLAACAAGDHANPWDAARYAAPLRIHRIAPTTDPTERATYDAMFAVYTDLYPALRDVFRSVSDAARRGFWRDPPAPSTETPIQDSEGESSVETTESAVAQLRSR